MKIKSGGANRARRAQSAAKTEKAGKAEFSGVVDEVESTELDPDEKKPRSQLLQDLSGLAKEIEEGKTSKEEANRRFVGMVIRDRYGEQKGKGAQKMEESIADMVEDDPRFVSRLHLQLKKLAKS